jgi:glycosyltransferase involved in cell wall biosynthesis
LENTLTSVGKRILFIDASASVGGGKAYINELIPRLAALLQDWRIILLGADRSTTAQWAAKGIPAYSSMFVFPRGGLAFRGVSKAFWRLLVLPLYIAMQRRDSPAVLFTTANVASPLLGLFRVPVVSAVHNLTPFHTPAMYRSRSRLLRLRDWALLKWTISTGKRATAVLVFSEYGRSLLTMNGVPERICSVIYHGRPEVATQWTIGPPLFSVVGHYYPYKRLELVVEACRLLKDRGENFTLRMEGVPYNRPYYDRIKCLVAKYRLQDRVHLGTGLNWKQLQVLYSSSRALVFPSVGENCPVTLLEALTIGVPIIGTSYAPVPEICGNAATYFTADDPQSLADAMQLFARDTGHCSSLHKASLSRATAFSWDEAARCTADLIGAVSVAEVL